MSGRLPSMVKAQRAGGGGTRQVGLEDEKLINKAIWMDIQMTHFDL